MDKDKRIEILGERILDALDLKYRTVFVEALQLIMKEDSKVLEILELSLGGYRNVRGVLKGDIVKITKEIPIKITLFQSRRRAILMPGLAKALKYARVESFLKVEEGAIEDEPLIMASYDRYDVNRQIVTEFIQLPRSAFETSNKFNVLPVIDETNFTEMLTSL